MDWSGSTGNPVFNGNGGTLKLYGSFILESGVRWISSPYYGKVEIESNQPGQIINTAGVNLMNFSIKLSGGGGWDLQDSIQARSLSLYEVDFNSNSHPMNFGNGIYILTTDTMRTLDFGTSAIQCGTWQVSASTPLSQMHISQAVLSCSNFQGGGSGNVYGDVICSNYMGTPTTNCIFRDITCDQVRLYGCQIRNLTMPGVHGMTLEGTGNTIGKAILSGNMCAVQAGSTKLAIGRKFDPI